jgi:transcriptional regulator with XRE-family HTH domain
MSSEGSSDSAALLVRIQVALGLTQEELGELIGHSKRTIQRWQSRGTTMLTGEQARLLAGELGTAHADLAEQVLALGAQYRATLGTEASPQALQAILEATALEGAMTSVAARPLVEAAFQQAAAEGVTVQAVLAALRTPG